VGGSGERKCSIRSAASDSRQEDEMEVTRYAIPDDDDYARDEEDATNEGMRLGLRKIEWAVFLDGEKVAVGGKCIDPDCHCDKSWTYWSK
jgi:hypothetical protein